MVGRKVDVHEGLYAFLDASSCFVGPSGPAGLIRMVSFLPDAHPASYHSQSQEIHVGTALR